MPTTTGPVTQTLPRQINVVVYDDLNAAQTDVDDVFFFKAPLTYRINQVPASTDTGYVAVDNSSTYDLQSIEQYNDLLNNGYVWAYAYESPTAGAPGSSNEYYNVWAKIPILYDPYDIASRTTTYAKIYTTNIPSLTLGNLVYTNVAGTTRKAEGNMSAASGKINPNDVKQVTSNPNTAPYVTDVIFGPDGNGNSTYYLVTMSKDSSTAPSTGITMLKINSAEKTLNLQSTAASGATDWYYAYIAPNELGGSWEIQADDSDGVWYVKIYVYWGYPNNAGAPQALSDDMCLGSQCVINDTS
jgi:hypothetical protein